MVLIYTCLAYTPGKVRYIVQQEGESWTVRSMRKSSNNKLMLTKDTLSEVQEAMARMGYTVEV